MPNHNEHLILGAVAGAATYLGYKLVKRENPTLAGLFATGAIGAGAAALPDLLEPAVSPNHRAGFHSWLAAGALGLASTVSARSELSNEAKLGVLSFAAGYGSHLLADATTPKGLPLLP